MTETTISESVLDFNAMAQLRAKAQANPDQVTAEVAEQFESIFINMMMKSMREATQRSGLLDSQAGRLYESMFDQQISSVMAKRGVFGVADALQAQIKLHRQAPAPAPERAMTLTAPSFALKQDQATYSLDRTPAARPATGVDQ